jgi:hypothetical protein
MPPRFSLSCGYLCDVLQAITIVAYRYGRILFHIVLTLHLSCVCMCIHG